MKLLVQILGVAGGGALGSVLRLLVSALCGRLFGTGFPVGTFVVNITGCVMLGWFQSITQERLIVSDTTRLAIAVGFVGAYTTFSTFAYESNSLLEDGSGLKSGFNLLASLLLGLVAVRLGAWLGGH